MTDLLSPARQDVAVNSSRPATPANTVPPEAHVGSTSQEMEVDTDKSASFSPRGTGSSPTSSPAEDIKTDLDSSAREKSKVAIVNGEENPKSTPVTRNEPEDEIVVGTRTKKAPRGPDTSETLEEQTKFSTNETTDERQTRLRLLKWKRRRVSRSVAQEEETDEEKARPVDSRTVKLRLLTRENMETSTKNPSEDLTASDKPVARQSSPNGESPNAQLQLDNRAMEPLVAPVRPVLRQPRAKRQRLSINPAPYPPMDISDSELSEAPSPKHAPIVAAPLMAAPQQQDPEGQPAGDKARILLGYWKHSSEQKPEDKHAVMAVLGHNNQMRPRLVKATRDGRPLIGNHPVGPGSVWRNWDEIEFEPHIRHLTRSQLKEYVRIRQHQKEAGETPQDEAANSAAAAKDAEAAIEAGDQSSVADFVEPSPAAAGASAASAASGTPEAQGTAQKRRRRQPSVMPREPNRRKRTPTVEQLNARAQQEVAQEETIQRRNNQRVSKAAAPAAAAAAGTPAPANLFAPPPTPPPRGPGGANNNRRAFDQARGGMQRTWTAQAEAAVRNGVDDAKMYLGTRYEFKRSGDFEGMYATHGTLIAIGDEDYVETRVLRKVGRR